MSRSRDPNHNKSDLLTLTMASLIISIWMESADVRDSGDTIFAFTRWDGGPGSEKTYHGRKSEPLGQPSWTRRLLSWEAW